jgi:hypothetical protein
MLGTTSNKIYLSIADGKIIRRVAEGTPGAEAQTKKDGTVYFVLKYGFITGFLRNISVRSNQFQGQEMKDWQFDIEDGSEAYTLQIMYNSRYATSLINALSNPVVDFSKQITITPWMKVVNDKKKTSCYLKQGNDDISWQFTKDEPNGLPPLVISTYRGKEQYDDYEMMQFLEKYVETNVKPRLGSATHIDKEPNYDVPDVNPNEEDDLPF